MKKDITELFRINPCQFNMGPNTSKSGDKTGFFSSIAVFTPSSALFNEIAPNLE